jgi:hypothetical protein
VLRLNILFRGIAKCEIGDGRTVCFWDDIWTNHVLSYRYPRLNSYARSKGASVYEILHAEDLDSIFLLPLSTEALVEFEELQNLLQQLEYDETLQDKWMPIWGSRYTSKKYYSYVFKNVEAHPIFKIIWKSRCIPRVKFFAWLIFVDRLNTKDMLQRRNMQVQGTQACVLCDMGSLETLEHLFFDCPFAKECWQKIGVNWDTTLSLPDRFHHGQSTHNIPCFTEVTLIAAWELWKVRNDKIFQRRDPSLILWFVNFKSQCLLQSVRFKVDLRSTFCVWLDAFS